VDFAREYAANDGHNDELMIIHSDHAHGVGLVFPVLAVGHSASRCHEIGRVICTGSVSEESEIWRIGGRSTGCIPNKYACTYV